MDVQVNVKDRIHKPTDAVFAAIVQPDLMAHYFISSGSGPMQAGAKIEWRFDDVGAKLEVDVREVEPNRRISFDWSASGVSARVTIALDADGNSTIVRVNESGWPMTPEGVKRALGQTQGWTDFLCSLKAYLQHGINLRSGRTKNSH